MASAWLSPPVAWVPLNLTDDTFADGAPPRLPAPDQRQRTTSEQAAESQSPTPHPAAAPPTAFEPAGWTAVNLSAAEMARTTAAALFWVS